MKPGKIICPTPNIINQNYAKSKLRDAKWTTGTNLTGMIGEIYKYNRATLHGRRYYREDRKSW